jgi:hypothetical protein
LTHPGHRGGHVHDVLDTPEVVFRDRSEEGVKLSLVQKSDVRVLVLARRFVHELAWVRAHPSAPLGVIEDAVEETEVVRRGLDGLLARSTLSRECLDVVTRDPVQAPLPEMRDNVDAKEALVALRRGALAPERFQVGDQALASILDGHPLGHGRRHLGHERTQARLGHRFRQPVARAGLADRPELTLDLTVADAPLAVVRAALREDAAAAVCSTLHRSHLFGAMLPAVVAVRERFTW